MGQTVPEILPCIILPLHQFADCCFSPSPLDMEIWVLVHLLFCCSPCICECESRTSCLAVLVNSSSVGHLARWRGRRSTALNAAEVSDLPWSKTPGIEWEEHSWSRSYATRGLWTHLEFMLSRCFRCHFWKVTPTSVSLPLICLIRGPSPYFRIPTCQVFPPR